MIALHVYRDRVDIHLDKVPTEREKSDVRFMLEMYEELFKFDRISRYINEMNKIAKELKHKSIDSIYFGAEDYRELMTQLYEHCFTDVEPYFHDKSDEEFAKAMRNKSIEYYFKDFNIATGACL